MGSWRGAGRAVCGFLLGGLGQLATAQAQAAVAAPPPPPPGGEATGSPAAPAERNPDGQAGGTGSTAGTVPTGAAAPPAACFPRCRSGFFCHQGRCISRCNPHCAAQEVCTQHGQCVPLTGSPGYANPATTPWTGAPARPERPPRRSRRSRPAEPPQGAHEHAGRMVRLAMGVGGGGASGRTETDFGDEVDGGFDGLGGIFSVDVGAGLGDGWVLHARFSQLLLASVSLTEGARTGEDSNANVSFLLFAPALTYYLDSSNFYAALAPGVSLSRSETSFGGVGTSEPGFGANLDVGWEGWIGAQWGLGAVARLVFSTVPDPGASEVDDRPNLTTWGGGLALSVTYQ